MTYRFCQWDHERQRWETIQKAGSIFALRKEIRYYREYWSDCGLLVQRGRVQIGTRPNRSPLLPGPTESP